MFSRNDFILEQIGSAVRRVVSCLPTKDDRSDSNAFDTRRFEYIDLLSLYSDLSLVTIFLSMDSRNKSSDNMIRCYALFVKLWFCNLRVDDPRCFELNSNGKSFEQNIRSINLRQISANIRSPCMLIQMLRLQSSGAGAFISEGKTANSCCVGGPTMATSGLDDKCLSIEWLCTSPVVVPQRTPGDRH